VGDLSPHFSRREFDCHDGSIGHPVPELIAALERLRAAVSHRDQVDRPLRIVSGFRTAAYNLAVGGATHSLHLVNAAADIPPHYATPLEARAAGFTGVGHCKGWAVHVDVRGGDPVIFLDC
jgi:uncharacterized protein YcbK (DUF882 family)